MLQSLRTALAAGFRAALRVQLLLPWYACLLLLGLLQTWPLLAAGGAALRNPWLSELAGGDLDVLVDLFLDNPPALAAAGTWSLLLVPSVLLGSLLYSFFAGGVLSVHSGSRSFWAGCRRFCLPFVALSLVTLLLATLVVAVALGVAFGFGSLAGLLVALIGLALLNTWIEYARAVAVARNRRNPVVLLGQAAAFCVRHVGGVLVLALLATLLYALLLWLYALLAPLLNATPLAVVAQQALVFGTLWIKALRLAWAIRYIMAQAMMNDE